MIQIETLRIEEFRGIRELDLVLDRKTFAIWGPNGSGKSGVVDAIDFALTGSIARLSGPGTGSLSVLKHGPHVYQRDNAGAAKVTVGVHDPVSDQSGILTRTVKNASTFSLEPDTPELRAAVTQAQAHPEITLSRREVMKYVLTEPSARAQQVQALLKLDRVDQTRKVLMTARNKCSSELNAASADLASAEASVTRQLDLPSLLLSEVASVINKRRAVLGLPLLDEVTIGTDLHAGMIARAGGQAFNKATAVRDAETLMAALTDAAEVQTAARQLAAELDELSADPGILASLHHRSLLEAGFSLVDEPACPLCGVAWDNVDALRAHLQDKLSRSEAAADLERRILAAAASVQVQLRSVTDLIRTARPMAAIYGDQELPHRLQTWCDGLAELAGTLSTVDGAMSVGERLTTGILAAPSELSLGLTALIGALRSKPDETETANAQEFLTVAQERWVRLRLARASRDNAAAAHTTAKVVYDSYCAAADHALTALYKTVEADFSAYYRHINAEDESAFTATLEPSAGKLDLSVAFYDTGMFPPAAYHSEGHQDGMGVCMYLALVKQLLGDEFRFAVLDDVVMSVDRDHRRQFCSLLKDTFPGVQFIITTHDDVWERQMQASGLISTKSQARFHGWTVQGGPVYDQGADIWTHIDTALANEDVPTAAHKLRRYLEATASDLAERLRAPVTYRADGAHDLGELLAAVKGRHNALLKKAAASAEAWKNASNASTVQELRTARAKVIPEQEGESWVINKLVHNNDDWSAMGSADFAPILQATRRFLDLFKCNNSTCGSWIYVTGQPGSEEDLRCSCGSYCLNLRSK